MSAYQAQLKRGWQIHQQKQFADAERIYRDVLAKAPKDSAAWCYLGIVLHDQRRYEEAVTAYRTALAIMPEFPIALNNLGNSLRYVEQFEEADASFQRAIELKPDYVNAFKNRGTLHVWTGHLDTGLGYYEQALKINPNEAELHRNLGVIYLLQGRFDEGWREYQWRWRVGDLRRPSATIPVWDGREISGKSLLLSVEQGLGDTLHFARYAQILRDRGVRTTIYCQPPLLAMLQNSPELGRIYPNNLPLDQPFDFQCSLLDAADLLRTNLDTIPSCPNYVKPATHLVNYWSNRLPKPAGKIRVGIAWQGNPGHQADVYRSVPLLCFEAIAAIKNVELVSLQSGYGVEQLRTWRGAPITQLDSSVDQSSGDFMDTAAIMKSLDLIITSDTSIAHLAGALGVPTWIALGFIPDWRWLLDRSDSPWYPSVRLFRQPSMGNWAGVFEAMGEELKNFS